MSWKSLFRKTQEPEPTLTEQARRDPITPTLHQVIARREGRTDHADPDQRRVEGLKRQRFAILFDIEQGELATQPDNPWTQRMTLLTDAMQTVTSDLETARIVEPGPWAPLPALPITIERIVTNNPATVAFLVGNNQFRYEEDAEWAERGHQLARVDLVRSEGDPDSLVPDVTPPDLRDSLTSHLEDTLFVFATDLRDRALDGEELPSSPTLDQLSKPCPICGGWTDWRGTCQHCARRTAREGALRREEDRLLAERNREADERHKLVEGLSLARKRLRDVETELRQLESH